MAGESEQGLNFVSDYQKFFEFFQLEIFSTFFGKLKNFHQSINFALQWLCENGINFFYWSLRQLSRKLSYIAISRKWINFPGLMRQLYEKQKASVIFYFILFYFFFVYRWKYAGKFEARKWRNENKTKYRHATLPYPRHTSQKREKNYITDICIYILSRFGNIFSHTHRKN